MRVKNWSKNITNCRRKAPRFSNVGYKATHIIIILLKDI